MARSAQKIAVFRGEIGREAPENLSYLYPKFPAPQDLQKNKTPGETLVRLRGLGGGFIFNWVVLTVELVVLLILKILKVLLVRFQIGEQ